MLSLAFHKLVTPCIEHKRLKVKELSWEVDVMAWSLSILQTVVRNDFKDHRLAQQITQAFSSYFVLSHILLGKLSRKSPILRFLHMFNCKVLKSGLFENKDAPFVI